MRSPFRSLLWLPRVETSSNPSASSCLSRVRLSMDIFAHMRVSYTSLHNNFEGVLNADS